MKEFIEFIAKQLVDSPDKVTISEEEKEGKIVLKLRVADPDVGKIIGRKGRSAQAMRVLLSAIAAKNGKRAILEVDD
ncbi:MAG: KH domain-containing protein [Acidobacteriota bacterium]|jgi:uncharacterized protein|nr:KH domain-containing protein [Bacteroidota bacterium]